MLTALFLIKRQSISLCCNIENLTISRLVVATNVTRNDEIFRTKQMTAELRFAFIEYCRLNVAKKIFFFSQLVGNGSDWNFQVSSSSFDENVQVACCRTLGDEGKIFEINETEIRREFPFNGNQGNVYRSCAADSPPRHRN